MKRTALALLLAAAGVAAQTPAVAPRQTTATAASQAMTWTAISGQASDLSVGSDGVVFAVDPDGRVWLRRAGANASWVNLPGDFRRIAAAAEKNAWAVDANGDLYAYNGTWWRPMAERFPLKAADVAVSANGIPFATTSDGKLLQLDARRGAVDIPDAPGDAVRVAVDDRDLPWIIDKDGAVHRFDGKRWTTLPTLRANDLAVANGGIWLIATDGQLVALDATGTAARPVNARAAAVATAPGGLPWIATADGRIYANHPNTTGRVAASRTQPAQVFTQLLNWQRVNGSAKQLAISPNGAVLALGREGEVWQWKGRKQWGRLPGSFTRIALDKDNTPWGIATDGRLMRYQGSYWTHLPGAARDIVGGADGSLWIIQPDDTLARWQARQRVWQTHAPATEAKRLAIAPDGQPWVVDAAGTVKRFDGKEWTKLPEIEATDLAISPEGSVFITDEDKRLWRWDVAGKRWERLNGEATGIAVGPRGKPWIVTADATIFASAFFDELPDSQVNTVSVAAANAAKVGAGGTASGVVGQPGTGTGTAKARADELLQYRKLTGTARDIAISADGSVFVVTYDGGLARWSNMRNAFVAFTGQFARIAVATNGKPWGVTMKGEVFRHDGVMWQLVRNITAQDVAIGYDGTVIVAGPQNVLHKYDPATDAFVRLPQIGDNAPPAGTRVAVDPTGKPWVIDTDGFVAQCGKGYCERMPVKARSLDIGPEGSVIIVDTDRILKRWNARDEKFERIDGIADLIDLAAVGPRGKPWLLSTKSEVWSSEFFPRDESRDSTTAAATAAVTAQNPTTSPPPVFTFLVNMTFDRIAYPVGFDNNPVFPPSLRIAFNPSGNPVVIDSSQQFWNYNPTTKQLVRDATPPSLSSLLSGDGVRSFTISKDGTYWISNTASGPPPQVYRRQGSQWIAVPGLSDCPGGGCLFTPMTVAAGVDGSIYATSNNGRIYRYDTGLKRFVSLNLPLPAGAERLNYVGVDPSGRLWATSAVSDKIYEYVDNTWVVRNDGTLTSSGGCIDSGTDTCFSIGANGSVYSDAVVSGQRRLLRWNPGSRLWEVVSTSPSPAAGGTYAIGPDGRPWVIQLTNPNPPPGEGFYRAR